MKDYIQKEMLWNQRDDESLVFIIRKLATIISVVPTKYEIINMGSISESRILEAIIVYKYYL